MEVGQTSHRPLYRVSSSAEMATVRFFLTLGHSGPGMTGSKSQRMPQAKFCARRR